MCAQCMAGAATACASAAGTRVWLAALAPAWMSLTERRLKRATVTLAVAAVLGSALIPAPTPQPKAPPAEPGAAAQTATAR